MPRALQLIIGGDATPLQVALKVLEQSSIKAGSQTAAAMRKAIETFQAASDTAQAAGKSTEFYSSSIAALNQKLAQMAALQDLAIARADRLAIAQTKAALAAHAASIGGAADPNLSSASDRPGIVARIARRLTGRRETAETGASQRAEQAGSLAGRIDDAVFKANVQGQTRVMMAELQAAKAAEAHKQAYLAKEAAIASALQKRKSHLDALAEYEQRLARKSAGAAAYLQRQIDDAKFKADVQGQSRIIMAEHQAEKAAKAEEARKLAEANSFMGRIRTFTSSIFGRFLGVGALIGAFYRAQMAIRNFISESIQADIAMQRIFNTLKSASGSSRQAAGDLQYLIAEAKRIGFSLADAADDFARFAVAATSAGYSAAQTRRVFTNVLEATKVMGLGLENTKGVMLALEQMLSKGRLSMEEVRRQLGNSMPAAMNVMAKALGLTLPQLFKAIESGSLDSADAISKFADELKRQFNLTPEMNKTIRDIDRLNTSLFLLKAAVGEVGRPVVSGIAESITSQLNRISILVEQVNKLNSAQPKTNLSTPQKAAVGMAKAMALPTMLNFGGPGLQTAWMLLHNPVMDRAIAADVAAKKALADSTAEDNAKKVFRLDKEAEALIEVASKEKQLNDLLLDRIKIMDLLKQKADLSKDAYESLKNALTGVNRQIQLNQEPDPRKKLEMQVQFANEDVDTAKQEVETAKKNLAEAQRDYRPGGTQAPAAAVDVQEKVLKNAEQKLQAAKDELSMFKEKPDRRHGLAFDITSNQRIGAYIGGPGATMLDHARKAVGHLASIDRKLGSGTASGRQPFHGGSH